MRGVTNLTEGNISARLVKLALPIMATSFIQMAYNLTDMFWVGRIGSEANAAVGSVGMFTWMAASFSLLCKVGAEVCVGQAIGKRETGEARRYASHNITLALAVSMVCALVMVLFAEPLIGVYHLSQSISGHAVSYMRIVAVGVPFIFLASAFTGIYNACGRSTIPFYISGTGLVANMLLDPLFIFGLDMGTDGAALATVLAQMLVVILFMWQMRGRDRLLDNFPLVCRLQRAETKRVVKIGAPVAVFNSLFAFANMFVSRIASLHGGHIGLMTFTTGGQIEAITWNTSEGFSTALSAFTAQNYAAGRGDRVLKAYKRTLAMTALFGIFGTVLFVCYGQDLGWKLPAHRRLFAAVHDARDSHPRHFLWHRPYDSAGSHKHLRQLLAYPDGFGAGGIGLWCGWYMVGGVYFEHIERHCPVHLAYGHPQAMLCRACCVIMSCTRHIHAITFSIR